MNAQQIDDILSQAKIDKNGRIMNKGRLNDMLHSLHLREVENLNKADVGGSLPSMQ
jgi:predicted RNA-binding protein (virulence factor B family)